MIRPPDNEMNTMSERLYIGIDLGTYQSTVMSSEGVMTTIETVVGKPKDNCMIPVFATKKKSFNKISSIF